MFKIKIEKKYNQNSDMCEKWFLEYSSEKHKPIFVDDEIDAGVFVIDQTKDNDLYGNLISLYSRFGYKGTPIEIK